MNKNLTAATVLLHVPSGKTRSPDDKVEDWVPLVLGPWLSQSSPICPSAPLTAGKPGPAAAGTESEQHHDMLPVMAANQKKREKQKSPKLT